MDDQAVVGIAVVMVLGLVAVAGIAAGVMYANDYEMQATVRDTSCDPAGSEVDVETKLFDFKHTVKDLPYEQCEAMHVGNFVEYRIRSHRTTIYAVEGGDCIYDSKTGPGCGQGPSGGGLFPTTFP